MDLFSFSFYIFMCIGHLFIKFGHGQLKGKSWIWDLGDNCEGPGTDEECKKQVTGVSFKDSKDMKVDHTKQRSILATDPDYAFSCCGVVSKWTAFFREKGNLRFQVWRHDTDKRGQWYTLIGENTYTVKGSDVGKSVDVDIHKNVRISVLPGDVIGWYFAEKELIGYKPSKVVARGRGFWRRHLGLRAIGFNVNWAGGALLHSRKYGVSAKIEKNSSPYFENLDESSIRTLNVNSSIPVDGIVYRIIVKDADSYDENSLAIAMTTKSEYFELQSSTVSVRLKKELVKGSRHKLDFTVKDLCGHTTAASLYIIAADNISAQRQSRRPVHVWAIGVSISVIICIASVTALLVYAYIRWRRENQVSTLPEDSGSPDSNPKPKSKPDKQTATTVNNTQ